MQTASAAGQPSYRCTVCRRQLAGVPSLRDFAGAKDEPVCPRCAISLDINRGPGLPVARSTP